MANTPPTRAADAWGALLRVHADLVPKLDRAVRGGAGMPLTWYDVLLELHRAPEHRLSMSELGARVVLSRTRVSRLVDELAGHGLVAREANPDDGRSSFAVLTRLGTKQFLRAAPIYLGAIEEHFGSKLTTAELRALERALGKVLG